MEYLNFDSLLCFVFLNMNVYIKATNIWVPLCCDFTHTRILAAVDFYTHF